MIAGSTHPLKNLLTTHLRRAALLVALVVRVGSAGAQAPPWACASSPGIGQANGTAVDAAGNVYVTGCFVGTATFGAFTLTSAGSYDVFVAKLTPGGAVQWAVRAGGPRVESGCGIAVDGSGSVIVTGVFRGDSASFGATTLTNPSPPSDEVFVARLSPAGAWLWATQAGGAAEDRPTGLALDGSGHILVSGCFTSATAGFGSTTLTNQGGMDVFVARLSPTGAWLWARDVGTSGYDYGSGLAVDGGGHAVITGAFEGSTATFGATTLRNANPTRADAFVAKLTPTGTWQWARSVGGRDSDSGTGVAVDGHDNIVVTGTFSSDSIAFGATTLLNSNGFGGEVFVARLTPAGTWQWATSAQGSNGESPSGVAVDGSGNVVITGVYLSPAITFGATTLTNSGIGYSDVFVAQLSPSGSWQWATGMSSSEYDYVSSVAVDGSGNVAVSGCFNGPTATFGATTLTNPASPTQYAIFIGRLSTVTGLSPDASAPGLTLWPNPAHETVHLTGATAPTAQIIDALGRTVRTAPLAPGTSTLNLTGLPPGLYTVRAGTATRRLMVE